MGRHGGKETVLAFPTSLAWRGANRKLFRRRDLAVKYREKLRQLSTLSESVESHMITVVAVLYVPLIFFWRKSLYLLWQSWLLGSFRPLWNPSSVSHLFRKIHLKRSIEWSTVRSNLWVTCNKERLQACAKVCFHWPSRPLQKVRVPQWMKHLFKKQKDSWRQLVHCHLYNSLIKSASPLQVAGKINKARKRITVKRRLFSLPKISFWKTYSSHDVSESADTISWLDLKDEDEFDVLLKHNTRFSLYKKVPLRLLSRLWGQFNQLELPMFLRHMGFRLYIWLYGCKLHEAEVEDIRKYRNLSEFFRRSLKSHLRPIDHSHELVSPADGTLLYFGEVNGGVMEQVKGITYSLKSFFGPLYASYSCPCDNDDTDDLHGPNLFFNIGRQRQRSFHSGLALLCESSGDSLPVDGEENHLENGNVKFYIATPIVVPSVDQSETLSKPSFLHKNVTMPSHLGSNDAWCKRSLQMQRYSAKEPLLKRMNSMVYADSFMVHPGNQLYHAIVYLSPGDYHRFHSPADWTVYGRRHFSGELFSVKPAIASWLQGLFCINERALYIGSWQHGFFSMALVGATNVGSINVFFDKDLVTNTSTTGRLGHFQDKKFFKSQVNAGIHLKKGDLIGEFNLGSTVVLIFEAPPSFNMELQAGQKLIYGQGIGR